VGGFIQFAGVWTPISNFLHPVAPPLVDASGVQEALSSVFAVGFGIAGIAVAWYVYSAHREPAPAPWPLLERKFAFDEIYDAVFYRPAVATARALFVVFETPFVLGSGGGVAALTRVLARRVRSFQTGLVRTYVLAVAG